MKHKNIVVPILVLFAILIIYFTFKPCLMESFENTKKYTFIHVPKTGGTAINKLLQNNYSSYFDLYSNQYHNMVATKNNRPILCIREPTDRFLSIYNYWNTHVNEYHQNVDTSFKNFVHLLKTDSDSLLFGYPPILSEYHYFPQSSYIDPSVYSHAIVITYDKNKLEDKVNSLLEYLGISNNNNNSLTQETVSNHTDVNPDSEDMNFIRERYNDDYLLWNKLNKQPDLFLKVF
jgi:Sulfotransferase family